MIKDESNAYLPSPGEICLLSPPNCDDENGAPVFFKQEILWLDTTFVCHRKPGCWPTVNKWDHIIVKPIPEPAGE